MFGNFFHEEGTLRNGTSFKNLCGRLKFFGALFRHPTATEFFQVENFGLLKELGQG